jgi:hypothetical protein
MSSFRVVYREKNGQPAKPAVFGSEALARAYARSVKGTVEPVAEDVPAPHLTKCPEGTAEMVRASARAYYLHERYGYSAAGLPEQRAAERDEELSLEQRAEQEMEYVCQARLMGVNVNDALADLHG